MLEHFVPRTVRLRARKARAWWGDARRAATGGTRPVFSARSARPLAPPERPPLPAVGPPPTGPTRAPVRVSAEVALPAEVAWPVTFARSGATLFVGADETLLEAGRAAGLPLAFSCTMGGCGACCVTLIEGVVELPEPHCLTVDEIAAGDCLACIARPRGPLVVDA